MKNTNVEISKTSGFCMGVNNVVSIVDKLLEEGKKVCTLGPIIHNPKVVENFKNRGVKIVNKALEFEKDFSLVIRSHGVTKSELEYIQNQKFNYIDGTCPFVKKIHNIASKHSDKTDFLLVAGNENHPEVIGIRSYFSGKSFIFKNLEELKKIVSNNPELKNSSVLVIAQTTYNVEEWNKCTKYLEEEISGATVFNTICNTTGMRQKEALELSKNSDVMIVIGGKQSSNTLKLYNICSENAPTIWIEDADELENIDLKKYENIGIVAGASTPKSEINRAYEKICIL